MLRLEHETLCLELGALHLQDLSRQMSDVILHLQRAILQTRRGTPQMQDDVRHLRRAIR